MWERSAGSFRQPRHSRSRIHVTARRMRNIRRRGTRRDPHRQMPAGGNPLATAPGKAQGGHWIAQRQRGRRSATRLRILPAARSIDRRIYRSVNLSISESGRARRPSLPNRLLHSRHGKCRAPVRPNILVRPNRIRRSAPDRQTGRRAAPRVRPGAARFLAALGRVHLPDAQPAGRRWAMPAGRRSRMRYLRPQPPPPPPITTEPETAGA